MMSDDSIEMAPPPITAIASGCKSYAPEPTRLGHGAIRTQEIYSHMIHGQDDMLEAGLEAIPRSSFFERKMLARQNPMNR